MTRNNRKALCTLVLLLIVAFSSMMLADHLQKAGGKVEVITASIDEGDYSITYKIYVPKEASSSNPLPALLCLHGYQNDRETSAAFALEAAKRGMVALAIDEYGHGYNTRSMKERGWTEWKIQGQNSDGTETTIKTKVSGPERFRVMMNFSTLSFFKGEALDVKTGEYVKVDAASDGLRDSSMGGIAAYEFLSSLPFVDSSKVAITGHSMGTWASWSVAAACQDHAAVILQCGEVFGENIFPEEEIEFHNVLMLQARYDEFNYFRDYRQETVNDTMLTSGIRTEFFTANGRNGEKGPFTWNTTYGDMSKGTARRVELIETNHRLTTHDGHAIAAAMEWLTELFALDTISPSSHTYMVKEVLVMVAMLSVMGALCPLVALISSIPFFRAAVTERDESKEVMKTKKAWWNGALISIAISAVTYPFMTQLGHGLLPLPENIFRMTIGNGFMTWYMTLAIISVVMTVVTRAKNRKKGKENLSYYSMGLSEETKADRLDWNLLGRSFLLSLIAVGAMYALVCVFQCLFQLDLRFIWPFFKVFSTERFLEWLVYLPFFSFFFVVNVGYRLFGYMRQEKGQGTRGFMKCWGKNVIVLLGGLLVIILLEYIPFFMGLGPGADLVFSSTFGGPFMSALILLVPQFIVFTFLSTWLERKTGYVYVGAFISAMLATWIVTGGSAMF